MTWAAEDVTDSQAEWCEEQHFEPRLDCPYCQTRAGLRFCARCEQEVWPHETCPTCHDLPPSLVDGFGHALVTSPTGVGG